MVWSGCTSGLSGWGWGVGAGRSYQCCRVMWNSAGCRQFWDGVDLWLVVLLDLRGITVRIVLTRVWLNARKILSLVLYSTLLAFLILVLWHNALACLSAYACGINLLLVIASDCS